ncbi:MAG: hypothetical protein ABI575_03925, partial [Oxalobacteraceae bacterium]
MQPIAYRTDSMGCTDRHDGLHPSYKASLLKAISYINGQYITTSRPHKRETKDITLRFIHTSDWHLGQTLHNFERGFEH